MVVIFVTVWMVFPSEATLRMVVIFLSLRLYETSLNFVLAWWVLSSEGTV